MRPATSARCWRPRTAGRRGPACAPGRSRTSSTCRPSTPTRSSPAAAASRGARTTAARRSRASAFTPVESDCKESLVAMHFTTEANGFLLLADGTVLQTIDRGIEFAQKTSVPGTRSAGTGGNAEPTDITFVTDAVGFAATSQGKIFQTTDAGNTWKPVSDTNRGGARHHVHRRDERVRGRRRVAVPRDHRRRRDLDAEGRRRARAARPAPDPLRRPELCVSPRRRRATCSCARPTAARRSRCRPRRPTRSSPRRSPRRRGLPPAASPARRSSPTTAGRTSPRSAAASRAASAACAQA